MLPHPNWRAAPEVGWGSRGSGRYWEDRDDKRFGKGSGTAVHSVQLFRWIGLSRYGKGGNIFIKIKIIILAIKLKMNCRHFI